MKGLYIYAVDPVLQEELMRRQGEKKIMANENNPSMKLINQFHDDHKWRQFIMRKI